ncbi:GNAT family N-acetyltransferase [Micromonospora sp. WMMA1923]|uniref:GNAT family N-acetyltransferase n=1 Tax=Micromonospora sp. WMMA1923 TaxID=3404125 RepID=UPI003B94CCCC
MGEDRVTVRPATAHDVDALVALRVANADVHLALDPLLYRMPPEAALLRHFTTVLADAPGRNAVFVAEWDGRIVGMVEVLRDPDPPAHRLLRPEPSAQIHTVVSPEVRARGVGSVLVAAAERWAAAAGMVRLSAGIHHANDRAVGFYQRHGFVDAEISLVRRLDG